MKRIQTLLTGVALCATLFLGASCSSGDGGNPQPIPIDPVNPADPDDTLEEGTVTLEYYCDQLHRIFSVTDWRSYDAGTSPTDKGQPYVPVFYKRSGK